MSESRLPAHIEVAALIRQVSAAGGFATVLHKGERDGGTILVVLTEGGGKPRLFERMPQPSGERIWTSTSNQSIENEKQSSDYLTRRGAQDPDLWIVELDIANGERFIGLTPPPA